MVAVGSLARLPRESRAPAGALFSFLAAVLWAHPATAQSATGPAMSDPKRVVVIVDDAGDVGLRISDAQMAHETVIVALRKRLGNDAVAYGGQRKNAATMKKMLGPNAETTIQDTQLVWFDAAEAAAPWRVRVTFGTKKNEHWVTAACRKASKDSKASKDAKVVVVDQKTGTGKNFLAARDALAKELDAFCPGLPAATVAIPIEGATDAGNPANPVPPKKKELKPWTPPPRRD